MKFIVSFVVLFFTVSTVQAAKVYQYSSIQVPITVTDTSTIGNVAVEQRNDNYIWLDYDLDASADCQISKLAIHVGNDTKTFNLNKDQEISNLDGVDNTYLTPRDAVIRLTPHTNQIENGMRLTSDLTLACPNKQVTAHTGTIILQRSSNSQQTDTNIGSRIVTKIRSWVDGQTSGDGYILRYDSNRNQWYWDQSNAVSRSRSVYPTNPTATTRRTSTLRNHLYEGKTSGDGYYLHYNTTKGQWCWRTANGTC